MDPVGKAIEEAPENGIATEEVTLSSGVVLRGKQAPPLILIRIMGSHPRPKAPVVFMKAMGRNMVNEADPDFQKALQAWQGEMTHAILTALISLGTEVASIPEGMSGPNDDAWLQEYSILGQDMEPENTAWRYLTWVMFKAAVHADDIKKIQEVVGKLTGVSEASVEAAENFSGSDKTDRRKSNGSNPA